MNMNCRSLYAGIGIAAVANIIVGAIWYSPFLFGKLYQQHLLALGITPDVSKMVMATLGSLVAALVIAAGMSCFMMRLAITNPYKGVIFGAKAWLAFVAPITIQGVLYAKWPLTLYLINNGYNLTSLVVMSVILALSIRRCEI